MKKIPAFITLALITLVAAGLLALTDHITREPIAQAASSAAHLSRCEALPQAETFVHLLPPEGVNSICEGMADDQPVGRVGMVTVKGYGGPIEVIAGVDTEGKLTGLRVGGSAFAETAGLGSLAKEPAFTDQFIGKTVPVSLGKDVDAISGATITSRSVVEGVNFAIQAAQEASVVIEE